MTLALIHGGAIILTVAEGRGFNTPDGARVSPAYDGWEQDGYALATIADANPIPEGKVSTGRQAQMVEGAPKWVHTLVDAPELSAMSVRLTARQIRLGLINSGIALATVEAMIAGIEDEAQRSAAQVEWEYASEYERNHWLVAQLGGALGLTEAQIDAMWLAAWEF